MGYWDAERFEKAINRSYERKTLTEDAKNMLGILIDDISKTSDQKGFNREQKQKIKDTCLYRIVQDWKKFYEAKKPIPAYFTDLCKLMYSSECRRLKQEIGNQQTA